VNEGEIVAGNITAEFSRSYSDVVGAKITASNGGSILLNGGQTGDLQIQGEFFATGATGGMIDFRGKTVNLIGANLDASGKKSGGTILIGGDYQGSDPTGLGTLSNAQTTFVDQNSRINASAVNTGDGGKVIIWADGDTDFRGNITAQGGSKSGDGGFVEVSGKQNLKFLGKVDVDATNGEQGNILLDPTDIIINADDENPETFDISNIYKLKGNITLSATNDIIFNVAINFNEFNEEYGTITLTAGGKFSFFHRFNAGGRDLKISASSFVFIPKLDKDGRIEGANIELESKGAIDIDCDISSSKNITLKANSYIVARRLSTSNSGAVKVSANGYIWLQEINTQSINYKSGDISLVSTGESIDTGAIYSNSTESNAGSVNLNAFGTIWAYGINASSTNGLGGNVNLTSQTGSIIVYDLNNNNNYATNGYGDINSFSFNANAGNVVLKANNSITVGEINAYAVNGGGIAGRVKLEANQDVLTRTIYASSRSGNGNNISITSVNGGINTNGGLISATSLVGGNGGMITLKSARDIKTGDIFARSRDGEVTTTGVWNGGRVTLDAGGNIETGYITTTSLTGTGGNINLLASGESIKVNNTLNQNDVDYSIISSGLTKNGRITIQRKSGTTGGFFAVGDATDNGTKGAISAGKGVNGVENSLLATTIVTGTYVDGNIRIVNPDIPASSLSKPRTIPPETPTTTYTFTLKPDDVQNFINKREYEKAIVALDNLRTVEFYQAQGNTTPTVPQLGSVNDIKKFLTAGDKATGSKSAMIYTFISTNQANPNGSALNLFAVTTTDVIYKTIPLINGHYQKLVAGQYKNINLDTTITDYRNNLRDTGSVDYLEQDADLYDLLFRPLKSALSQVDNLVFSTDKIFRTIPFAALYDNRTSDNDGTMHLVEKYSSSFTPSFQVIEKDRYKSLKSANVIKMGATEAASDFNPLASVRTELENIAKIELQSSPNIKHSPIYLNKQFSKSNLQFLIAKNDSPIVHLATHGKRIRKDLDGYIQLGTTQSANSTDRLTASEIRQLDGLQNKDLIVFSACQTVLHEDFGYGLAGAALVAGVKSATGSCWDVSDAGNMILMTGFYQQLLGNGLSKTKALQEAQKAMLLGMVRATPVNGATDKLELSINVNKVEYKVESSEYGQKDIKNVVTSLVPEGIDAIKHPFYWSGTFLLGNPW
jgi:CHAT domain-containing protein